MNIIQHVDRPLWRGDWKHYKTNWSKEIQRDRQGIIREAPPCIDLEHRHGVCPMGLKHDTRLVEGRNTIVANFYENVAARLIGTSVDTLDCTYIAVGTGAGVTTDGMDALEVEVHRDLWTDRTAPDATTSQFAYFLNKDQANYYLHEFGAFAGTATSATDSGLLLARWLDDWEKTSADTLNGTYTISRA